MGKMGEYAVEHPIQDVPVTLFVKTVVHLASGKTLESTVKELDEDQYNEWRRVVSNLKNIHAINVPLSHALGWEQVAYINPTYIEAIEIIIVPRL
jgi:hypothetical protein